MIVNIVDTKMAIKYAVVLGSYDIAKVDKYLNDKTMITYNGASKTYKELRDNVIAAFEKKEYEMSEGSSYGSRQPGNPLKRVQKVGIQAYATSDYHSDYVEMGIERHWLFFFKVKSLKSDDSLFGHIFFRELQTS